MHRLPIVRAASVIICDSENRILLARRSALKSLDPGLWETIGGKVEPGETSPEALLREVREELGRKTVLKDVEYFRQYTFESKSNTLVSDVFTASMEGSLAPCPEEIAELGWFAKDEALKLDFCVDCQKRVEDFYSP